MLPTEAATGSPVEREYGHAGRIALLFVGKRTAIARLDVCRRRTGGGRVAWHQQHPNRRDEDACGFLERRAPASLPRALERFSRSLAERFPARRRMLVAVTDHAAEGTQDLPATCSSDQLKSADSKWP
jgi:hypothetical protein